MLPSRRRRNLAALLAGATALAAATPAPAAARAPSHPLPPASGGADSVTAIVNVAVVPMDRERVLERQTVVVRGGRIVALGPAASTTVPAGAARIDGTGKYLMPGLADMHAHVPGGAGEAADPAGRWLSLLLANGVTVARGIANSPTALRVRDRVRSGELLGPTMVVYGPSLNNNSVASMEVARRIVGEQKAAGFEGLKTHGGIAREMYDTIAAAARREGMPLIGHVTHHVGLAHAAASGQQIEHLDGFIAALAGPGVQVPPGQLIVNPEVLGTIEPRAIDSLAGEMRRRNVFNGPTLALFSRIVSDSTAEQLLAEPDLRYYFTRQQREGMANQRRQMQQNEPPAEGRRQFVALRNRVVKALADSGAKLLVGSDSPQFFFVPGFAVHREIQALANAGLTPYQALAAATRDAAEFLGRAADLGTVAVGRQADLVLVDANPLASVANAQRIAGVMVRGRWLPRAELDRMLAAAEQSAGAQ